MAPCLRGRRDQRGVRAGCAPCAGVEHRHPAALRLPGDGGPAGAQTGLPGSLRWSCCVRERPLEHQALGREICEARPGTRWATWNVGAVNRANAKARRAKFDAVECLMAKSGAIMPQENDAKTLALRQLFRLAEASQWIVPSGESDSVGCVAVLTVRSATLTKSWRCCLGRWWWWRRRGRPMAARRGSWATALQFSSVGHRGTSFR